MPRRDVEFTTLDQRRKETADVQAEIILIIVK